MSVRQVAEQNGWRVRYFGLNIQDPALSQPGGFEAARTGFQDEATHSRDRHVLLRCLQGLVKGLYRFMRRRYQGLYDRKGAWRSL